MSLEPGKRYLAVIELPAGEVSIQLEPENAPATVNNFVHLAGSGFFDGLTIHRVEPGFVIQGGDPLGTGTGGPGYRLPDETSDAPWVEGSVGMASNAMGVSGSQFFICMADAHFLAGSGVYNHFGLVTAGMDAVRATRRGDVIRSVRVEVTE